MEAQIHIHFQFLFASCVGKLDNDDTPLGPYNSFFLSLI